MTSTTNTDVVELLEEGLQKIPAHSEPSGQDQTSLFAAGRQPLLQGMLALARIEAEHYDASNRYLRIIRADPGKFLDFPSCTESSRMVVLSNPPARGYGPTTARLFAPDGTLGLEAVTFHESGEFGLVLPRWVRASAKKVGLSVYTVVTIRQDGWAMAHSYEPILDVTDLPRPALGTIDQRCLAEHGESGTIDSMVGFPEAGVSLARLLPRLGRYFEELATEGF